MTTSVSVKLHVNNEVRRFNFSGTSFAQLTAQCVNIANLSPTEPFQFLYADDEDDLVAFSTDIELQYAIGLIKTEPKLLRVHIVPTAPSNSIGSGGIPIGTDVPPFGPPDPAAVRGSWRMRGGFHGHRGGGGRGGGFHMGHRGGFHEHPMMQHHHAFHHHHADFHSHEGEGGHYRGKYGKIKDLDARFVGHVTHEDGEYVVAGTTFQKVWRVRNNGASRWPEGTSLIRVDQGNELSAPHVTPLTVHPAPSEEVDIVINLHAPINNGQYTSYFKFLSPAGKKFGQRMRCQVLSVSAERYAVLKPSQGSTPTPSPLPTPQQSIPPPVASPQQQRV